MSKECTWRVRGTVAHTAYKTGARGNYYWILMVRVETCEICIYVHDESLQRITENLNLGTLIDVTGVIEPHSRVNQSEKPYFLTPASIQISADEV